MWLRLSKEGVEMSELFAYKHCSRDCHRWCRRRTREPSESRFSCANSIYTSSAHYYFISTRCHSVSPTIPHSQVSVDDSEPLPPPLPSCTLHLHLFSSLFFSKQLRRVCVLGGRGGGILYMPLAVWRFLEWDCKGVSIGRLTGSMCRIVTARTEGATHKTQ